MISPHKKKAGYKSTYLYSEGVSTFCSGDFWVIEKRGVSHMSLVV